MAQTPKIIQCLLQRRIVCRFLRELLSYQKEKKVEAEKKKKKKLNKKPSTKRARREGRIERENQRERIMLLAGEEEVV